jgi:hypothetical protein
MEGLGRIAAYFVKGEKDEMNKLLVNANDKLRK